MKKILCFLTAISLLIINTTSAFAHSLFDKRWNQGEYIIELTDEEIARFSAIFETALKKSEGTPTRQEFDEISSYEFQYQWYLENGPIKPAHFDDIGLGSTVVLLPDEQAISSEQALFIAYHALQECYQLTDEQLTTILPFWIYYLLSDGSAPVWEISFKSYDFTNEFTCFALVAVFAYDGSIWGVNETEESYG